MPSEFPQTPKPLDSQQRKTGGVDGGGFQKKGSAPKLTGKGKLPCPTSGKP